MANERRIKILFVIDNIQYGGGERVFEDIVNGLAPARFTVHAACLPQGRFVEKIRGKAQIIPFDLRRQFDLRKPFQLARIIKSAGIDIVHSQGARADFYSRLAVALSRTARVVTTIAAPVEEFNVSALRKWGYVLLDRFSERYVDAFIAVSSSIEKRLSDIHRIPGQKITIISNGVDANRYRFDQNLRAQVRRRFGISPESLVVGTAGRLVWVKGHRYLLEAAKIITQTPHSQPVVFLIAGEGEDRADLERYAGELGVDKNVIFAGFQNSLNEFLSACDIFALPSIREGQPLVLLEAMAAARSVIATDIDGIREVISDGQTGMLVPSQDPTALAGGISALLRNTSLRTKLGTAAAAAVQERFSLEHTVRKHSELYIALRDVKHANR